MPLSTQIYIVLVVILAAMGALNAFLPQGDFVAGLSQEDMPASKPVMALVSAGSMLIIYGGLGYLGLTLARRLGFADIWDPAVRTSQRLLTPALIGVAVGVFFIIADTLFQHLHGLGALPHPPFPTSIVASASAGIGEEIIFRLFFVPFWVWLISSVILKGNGQDTVFWVIATVSALVFAVSHLPSVMMVVGVKQISQMPVALIAEIVVLNGVLSIIAAWLLRRYGLLAAVSVHFWADIVWHVVWGTMR